MSELQLFLQYAQLKAHSLVKRIFSRETQRPSAEKEWQMPQESVFPMPEPSPCRVMPLEVHATSYLAAADRIVSFCMIEGAIWMAGAAGCVESVCIFIKNLLCRCKWRSVPIVSNKCSDFILAQERKKRKIKSNICSSFLSGRRFCVIFWRGSRDTGTGAGIVWHIWEIRRIQ